MWLRAGVLAAALLAPAAPAWADITVNESSDTAADGHCSYDEAVAAAIAPATPSSDCPGANAGGTTTIRVPSGLVYVVQTSVIPAGADIAIVGGSADASQTVINSSSDRCFDIQAGASVALRDMTISQSRAVSGASGSAGTAGSNSGIDTAGGAGGIGGAGLPGGDGGAARNAGTLTVTNVIFDNDRAGNGGAGGAGGSGGIGGIRVNGSSSASGGNGGNGGAGGSAGGGGAIANSGTLTVSDSVFSFDTAGFAGSGGTGGTGGLGGNPNGTTVLGGQGGAGGPGGPAGGTGGNGGAILNSGTATITNSLFQVDAAGAGGDAGKGGTGGSGFSVSNPDTDHHTFAGPGGSGGTGGSGSGIGGYGGAVYTTGTLHLSRVWIFESGAGEGGGRADGGDGGPGGVGFGAKAGAGGQGGAGAAAVTGGRGGGVYAAGGTVTIDASTISQDAGGAGGVGGGGGDGGPGYDASVFTGAGGAGATGGPGGSGGALAMAAAVVTITNSTLDDHNAAGQGGHGGSGGASSGSPSLAAAGGNGGNGGVGGTSGAIFAALGGTSRIDVTSATIASNWAGAKGFAGAGGAGSPSGASGNDGSAAVYGGIADTGAGGTSVIKLTDTIVASNTPSNCFSVSDGGHNLRFGDTTCPGTTGDPKLDGTLNNGGLAPTEGLGDGSAALDAGAGCPAVDERGVTRPQGPACDIGAFERGAPPVCHDLTAHVPYNGQTFVDLGCSDVTGAPAWTIVDSNPPHGLAETNPFEGAVREIGKVLFVAPADFAGTETLTFHGFNGDGVTGVQTLTIVVDPPVAPTVTGVAPASPSGQRSVHVTGSGAPDGATVNLFTTSDCSGAPVATGTPAQLASPGLAETVDHDTTTTFRADYVTSGVTSACSTTSATYVEDETAPDTIIDGGPTDRTTEQKPAFTFHASEPAAAFACSLDQGTAAFAPCPAIGFTPALPLAAGTYTFRVRATDLVGLTDDSPATRTFTVTTASGGGGGGSTVHTVTATVGNQRVVLSSLLPASCLARTTSLHATLSSNAITGSKAGHLGFVRADFYIDRGVRHVHHAVRRRHGKKTVVTTVTYTPNATSRRQPATASFKLTGVSKGQHTVLVRASFHRTVVRHGHRRTVTVSTSLRLKFRVC